MAENKALTQKLERLEAMYGPKRGISSLVSTKPSSNVGSSSDSFEKPSTAVMVNPPPLVARESSGRTTKERMTSRSQPATKRQPTSGLSTPPWDYCSGASEAWSNPLSRPSAETSSSDMLARKSDEKDHDSPTWAPSSVHSGGSLSGCEGDKSLSDWSDPASKEPEGFKAVLSHPSPIKRKYRGKSVPALQSTNVPILPL